MKRILLLLFSLCFLVFSGRSQKNDPVQQIPNDTASYPYWVQMMKDPSVNFFKVQRAFNIYWKDRKITKGCGWKVFKRWEYMMQSRVLPNGDRPAPELAEHAYENFLRSTTTTNGNVVYKIAAKMESSKYGSGGAGDVETNDGGNSTSTYEQGTAATL